MRTACDPTFPQTLLDKSTPHVLYRWLAWLAVLAIYILRVVNLEGYERPCAA